MRKPRREPSAGGSPATVTENSSTADAEARVPPEEACAQFCGRVTGHGDREFEHSGRGGPRPSRRNRGTPLRDGRRPRRPRIQAQRTRWPASLPKKHTHTGPEETYTHQTRWQRATRRRIQRTMLPVGRSRSSVTRAKVSPSLAASNMPCDCTPRNIAGARFATSTTFLPSNCSGV